MHKNDNPIRHRELVYQARTLPHWLRYEPHTLLLLGAVFFLLGWAAPRGGFVPPVIWISWAVHVLAALRGLLAGASLISREHEGQTWEALILTGVSTRQIFWGKWAAVMRRVRLWLIWLSAVWFGMAITVHFQNTTDYSTGNFQAGWFIIDPLILYV